MTQRAELRRQWREHNNIRELQALPPIPWQQWGIGFEPLAEVNPELAASVDHLRGES